MPPAKKIFVLLGDVTILYITLFITLLAHYGFLDFFTKLHNHLLPFSILFMALVVVFYLADLYRLHLLRNRTEIFRKLIAAVFIGTSISMILLYLLGPPFDSIPKTSLVLFIFLFLCLETLWRSFVLRATALEKIRVCFLGDSPLIQGTLTHLLNNSHLGYEVAMPIITIDRDLDGMRDKIKASGATLLLVQPELFRNNSLVLMLYELLPEGMHFEDFSEFFERLFEKVPLTELDEEWFLRNVHEELPYYDKTKRVFEFVSSLALLLISLPLIFLISTLILITSGSPTIYTQKRAGKNQLSFTLYKFRTMYREGEGPLWTEDRDQRLTGLGKLLRASHLDELPQLLNILKGEISLIGPRPERLELAYHYSCLPHYHIRNIIKPGLTGWAQINFRPSASLEEAYEKLCYDIYYIKHRSVILDLFILLKTVKYVFVKANNQTIFQKK